MSLFQDAKLWMMDYSGLSKDALHIYVALAPFLGSAALFRWKLAGWRPWLVVLAAALIGEAWDLIDSLANDTPVHLKANWHDIWNALFWPTALLLLARWTKVLRR